MPHLLIKQYSYEVDGSGHETKMIHNTAILT